jgi:hypothetical protein
MISAPCTNRLIRGGLVREIAAGNPTGTAVVGAWVARSVPCEPRGLTVSHACDPRMHREPGILNRAYAKTVKLNLVKPTQERNGLYSSTQSIQLGRSSRYRPEISIVCTVAQLCVHLLCVSIALCTFAQYSFTTAVRTLFAQYREDVCTFAQYSCVYICPGVHGCTIA